MCTEHTLVQRNADGCNLKKARRALFEDTLHVVESKTYLLVRYRAAVEEVDVCHVCSNKALPAFFRFHPRAFRARECLRDNINFVFVVPCIAYFFSLVRVLFLVSFLWQSEGCRVLHRLFFCCRDLLHDYSALTLLPPMGMNQFYTIHTSVTQFI